ncbi:MAG TPA: sulfite exporter TauE/SafE family protein [Burkholderiales bacterium]|nr:sulfite exporter TauE/SafE family protein [Burkholderiales bacterium]
MEWWLGYVAIGAAVGFFAGMLGIGGGAIMVPLLVMLFEAQGLPKSHILHLAVGTGMATILFTSLASVRAHAARGAIRWDIARNITPGILLGGLVGSWIASFIPPLVFAALFTAVIYVAATNILLDRKPKPSREAPGFAGMFAFGFAVSAVSAFTAIGGAFMTVPFMLWCNVPLLAAIGTAAMIGFPIALSGTAGFVAAGLREAGLPQYSLGFVYLPAVAGIVVSSMLMAPVGAAAAHRLPTVWLKRIFAVLFYVMATRMLLTFV